MVWKPSLFFKAQSELCHIVVNISPMVLITTLIHYASIMLAVYYGCTEACMKPQCSPVGHVTSGL